MAATTDRRHAFRRLHVSGCFVLPNPWDVGSARYLQHLGFTALATTSAGAAFTLGLPDSAVPRDTMLAHVRAIVEASDLPVNADFGSGYAHEPDEVADNVHRCVATGVAGLSIEDASGDPDRPFYPLDLAVARIRAARAAIDATDADVVLTARAERPWSRAPTLMKPSSGWSPMPRRAPTASTPRRRRRARTSRPSCRRLRRSRSTC